MTQNPHWRQLLEKYLLEQLRSNDGWVDRISELHEQSVEELSQIHGKLIALNLLDFELHPQGHGMRYQVSSAGRTALLRVHSESESEESAETAASGHAA